MQSRCGREKWWRERRTKCRNGYCSNAAAILISPILAGVVASGHQRRHHRVLTPNQVEAVKPLPHHRSLRSKLSSLQLAKPLFYTLRAAMTRPNDQHLVSSAFFKPVNPHKMPFASLHRHTFCAFPLVFNIYPDSFSLIINHVQSSSNTKCSIACHEGENAGSIPDS